MKLFGTVKSFDTVKRNGSIKPEGGGDALGFEGSAFNWADKAHPKAEQRLSYELGKNSAGTPCAVNLQTI